MLPPNLLAFYRFVADRSPLPVLIYNVPTFTAYDMPAELVIELADHSNIIGIKESGGSIEKIQKMSEGTSHIKRSATVTETFAAVPPRMLERNAPASGSELVSIAAAEGSVKPSSSAVSVVQGLKTRQKEIGFQVIVGAAEKLYPSLKAGAVGAILAFADIAPMACYEVYAAWKEGDEALAQLKQDRIAKAAARIAGEMGIAGTKFAMDFNGYYGGVPRLPLLPVTTELKSEIERLLENIRS
jgi:dihydrodipicolinate synthase/N-acetylneuraminate lyase